MPKKPKPTKPEIHARIPKDVKRRVSIPDPPLHWYYARFQAVGRGQARYFLLCLLVSAYTFGLSVTPSPTVKLSILGLPDMPKTIVTAAATVVLCALLLALFGSFQAAREAADELCARLRREGVITDVPWHTFDEHPNLADFVSYATYEAGKPRGRRRYEVLVLYPLPVFVFVVWAVLLWRRGLIAPDPDPGWLARVYDAGAILVFAMLWCTTVFARRRWELFRNWKPTESAG